MTDDRPKPEPSEHETADVPSAFIDDTVLSNTPRRKLPSKIGQYKIKQALATGGMGTVYLAVQEHPKRTVALKVMKQGIVSAATLRRFEFESQVLARLRHPNIGQIYEAGTFDDGDGAVPFFAMEYIPHAKAIADYVQSKDTNSAGILEIFIKVCDAVHHGHQKGVIHRDLKPDNILVDAEGEPKIIDFGVARSTESDLAVSTMQTDVGQIVGTIQYMSPEQCDADPTDLDTRTDVYALGVVLYELLCGELPYDVTRVALFEAARVIKETAPKRPRTINVTLRGDLETITLKALEKDRDRRYQSATALADDLKRYLNNEPIHARSPSVAYQMSMFVRRNRAAFAAAVSIVAFLIIATIVSVAFGIQAVRSGRNARDAERDALYQRDVAVVARVEAQLAREESDRQRDAALAAEALAQEQSYLVNVAAAAAAIDAGAIETAKRRLRLAPEQMRSWEWQYLTNLADQSIATLTGHDALITSVAFSTNGSRIVSGSTDGSIRVTDLATGEETVQFKGHESPVYAIACSPDGVHFASASADMTVRLWNIMTGDELAVLRGHEGVVTSLAYGADGRFLVSGSSDASLRLWDARSGEELRKIEVEDTSVDCVAVSPDGALLASGSDDGVLRMWVSSTGGLDWRWDLDAGFINALSFTADGAAIGSATEDGVVRLWNTENGALISQLSGHAGFVSDIAFSPDSQHLVSGSEDGTIRLWNLSTGRQHIKLHGHNGFVNGVAFSPDGRRVASCSDDFTVKLWDAHHFELVDHAPDASSTGPAARVGAVAMSTDGARVIGGRSDGTVAFWDALTGSFLGSMTAHADPVRSIAVSADGSLIATASDDNTIKVWDAATARPLASLTGHTRRVTGMVFATDDTRLMSGSWDGSIKVWDLASATAVSTWQIDGGSINTIALSPRQSRLACASSNGDVVIIDTASGAHAFDLRGHTGPVNCLVYTADGARLVSGSSDSTMRLWDTSAGESVAVLRGHSQSVTAINLTPDGLRIISASRDLTMRVWTTDTGEEVATMPRQSDGIDCIAVSPDGFQVVSGSTNGSMAVRDGMPRVRRYQQRAGSQIVTGSAKRTIESFRREGLSTSEIAERVKSDESLTDTLRRSLLNRILQDSLAPAGS